MKKLIYKFLDRYCSVNKQNFILNTQGHILSSNVFFDDLYVIFGLNKKELKWYVKGWVRKQNKGFDFNKWFNGIHTININSITVNCGIRRIRARWTLEMTYDLATYHSIDAEAELTRILTEEINREILNEAFNP